MNGVESLVRTLVVNDVDVCFANPGTSEMPENAIIVDESIAVGRNFGRFELSRELARAFGRRRPYLVELVL